MEGRTTQDNYYASADASSGLPDNSKRRTVFHYPKKGQEKRKKEKNHQRQYFSESNLDGTNNLIWVWNVIFTHHVVEPHR